MLPARLRSEDGIFFGLVADTPSRAASREYLVSNQSPATAGIFFPLGATAPPRVVRLQFSFGGEYGDLISSRGATKLLVP